MSEVNLRFCSKGVLVRTEMLGSGDNEFHFAASELIEGMRICLQIPSILKAADEMPTAYHNEV